MSEPIKKPKKENPESYSPKTPAIVSMAEEFKDSAVQQTVTESGLINFEIVKFGPYRFIGRSVYANAWGPRDFIEFLWEQSGPIFKTLDEMKECASDDPNNAALRHWEVYSGEGMTHWNEVFFGKTELLGCTIGRFMKADTPVPENMSYIDIHEMYIAKAWMKGKPDDKAGMIDEGLMYDQIDRIGYEYVPMFSAELFPVFDDNGVPVFGSYVACRPLTGDRKAEWEKEKRAAEDSEKSRDSLVKTLKKMVPEGEPTKMEIETLNDSDGVWRQGMKTEQSFELPVRIKLHAKANNTNIRFEYGKGNVMFLRGCMRMHEIADGKPCVFHEFGGIPAGEFVDIEWILGKELMAIKINSELRHIGSNYKYIREFTENPDYTLSSPITVAAANGSTVTVESLRIAEI